MGCNVGCNIYIHTYNLNVRQFGMNVSDRKDKKGGKRYKYIPYNITYMGMKMWKNL